MNDLHLREEINHITGLEIQSQLSGVSTALVNATWVTVFSQANTTAHKKLRSFKITLSGAAVTTPVIRIRAVATGGTLIKIFPFSAESDVVSGVIRQLAQDIHIPKYHDWEIQVKAGVVGVSEAILDFASVMTAQPYDAS